MHRKKELIESLRIEGERSEGELEQSKDLGTGEEKSRGRIQSSILENVGRREPKELSPN